MKLIPLQIDGQQDEPTLAALHYQPDGPAEPLAVCLAHGFTSGKYSMDGLAGYLAEKGYPCVTFDAVGHKLGCTGGKMYRISQSADNLAQVLRWMRANLDVDALAAIGHSMGAAAAIRTAAAEGSKPPGDKPMAGIACICMGLDPVKGFDSKLGAAMLTQRSDHVCGAPVLELLSGLDGMLESAREIGNLPVLMIAAKSDVLLPVANVQRLADRIGPSVELHAIEAMHLDAPDRSRAIVIRWLDRVRGGRR